MSPKFEDPLEKLRQAASSSASGEREIVSRIGRLAQSPPAAAEPPAGGEENDGALLPALLEEDRMLSGLSYIAWFLVPPIVLLTEKKSEPYLRFHALQGLFTGIAFSLASAVMLLFAWLLSLIFAKAGSVPSAAVYVIIFSALALVYLALIGFVFFFAWRAHVGIFFRLPLIASIVDRYTPENFREY